MLKNIPNILSPELLKTLMEMGHGDELVIADGNFPAASFARKLVRLDGHGVPEVLKAILRFFPLDTYVEMPVALMAAVEHGKNLTPPIWEVYRRTIKESDERFTEFALEERAAFYERAKRAFAVVATSESALYANIILKKGVVCS